MTAWWYRAARLLLLVIALAGSEASAQQRITMPPESVHEMLPPTDHRVTVTAVAGLEELAGRVRKMASPTLASIAADLPELPVPAVVDIRLVKQVTDMTRMTPEGSQPPAWADGVAYPERGVVVVAANRREVPLDVIHTVRHELAHLALGAALGGRAPRWLNEGFAFLHSEDWDMARVQTLTGMAWSSDAYPLAELARHFPAGKHGANRAYAQAYDFVAFLSRRGRYADAADDGDRWAFRDFLREIAGGLSADEAARKVYRASLSELEAEWFRDLRERYFAIPVGLFGMSLWVLAALLLITAYIRKTLQNRRVLARWNLDENVAAGDAGPALPS